MSYSNVNGAENKFQNEEKKVPDGVEYAKTKSMSYSSVNGAENKFQNEEEKVSEPETEQLVSDIRTELAHQKESAEAEVKSSFQASLDIPSENVHETVSNSGKNGTTLTDSTGLKSMAAMKENLEFTPRVVAEYLYRTGETQEFQNLLNELVDASEITSEDAEQYEKAVMDELYQLEQEQNYVNVPQMDDLYQQEDSNRPAFPIYDSMQGSNDVYPLYGFGQNAQQKVPQESMADYVNYVLNKPVTLDEMINTIMDRWLTNAIVNGDQEAEEILSNIVDYVSRDNDPNDEEQVKAILGIGDMDFTNSPMTSPKHPLDHEDPFPTMLSDAHLSNRVYITKAKCSSAIDVGDIFAEALLEDLTPRIEPQDIGLGQSQLPIAQPLAGQLQQQQPEVAPAAQSIAEMTPQKSKRAKEVQEPAAVTGEELAVKM